ncbi:hypothetical protein [Methylomagnum sp.]
MKKLGWLVLVLAGFYGDGYRRFSEGNVRQFLVDFSMNAYQGNHETVCGLFADDVDVSINDQSPQGRWEVEGGKEEACGYIKQTSAAFMTLRAHVDTSWDDIVIKRSGFPWLTAEITYQQTTHITAGDGIPMPAMTAVSDDALILKRTLGGLRIVKLQSDSATAVD